MHYNLGSSCYLIQDIHELSHIITPSTDQIAEIISCSSSPIFFLEEVEEASCYYRSLKSCFSVAVLNCSCFVGFMVALVLSSSLILVPQESYVS